MLLHKKGFIVGGILLTLSCSAIVTAFGTSKLLSRHHRESIKKCCRKQEKLLKAIQQYQADQPDVFKQKDLTIAILRDKMSEERYILSKKLFECSKSTTPGSNDDYAIIFDVAGKVIAVECIEHTEHNLQITVTHNNK